MNIMNLVTGFVTPMLASKIAGVLGVPESAARRVLSIGLPLVLGAILKRGSSPGGADALGAALDRTPSNPLDSLTKMLGGGDASQVTAAASSGSDLLGSLLGGGTPGTIASRLGSYAGIDTKAAGSLLGLAGSMALGGLKKTADDQGLDAAGVLRLLESEKDDIAGAIPADFAAKLEGTDFLGPQLLKAARGAPATTPTPTPRAAPAPAPARGGASRWIIGLVVLALLAWLLSRFLGGPEETPVVEEEPPAAEEPAAEAEPPAEEPEVEPAPAVEPEPADEPEPAVEPEPEPATDTAAVPANPLLVDGVDIGASLQGAVDQITGTLEGVTDAASAQAALTPLTEADAALGEVQGAAANLPAEGASALKALVAGALPALQSTADRLLADTAIGPVLKPVIDGILAKLNALAA